MIDAVLFLLGFAVAMYLILRPRRCKDCGDTLSSRYPFDRCLTCRYPGPGTPDADRLLHELFD